MLLRRCNLTSIIFIALFFLFFCSVANSEEIVNITNGEWPPFLSRNLPNYGFASHVVSMAFDEVGVKVNYGFFPWKRAFILAKTQPDKWHGSVVWSYREDRAEWFYFSQPVMTQIQVFFHLKSRPSVIWKSIEDLKDLKVGIALGSSAPTFEDAAKKGILTLVRSGDTKSLFRMLITGRIDVIPMAKGVGYYHVRTQLSKDEQKLITDSPTIFEPQEYCLILSKRNKKNRQFLDLFNKGMERLYTSGKYDQMTTVFYDGKYDSR